MHDFQSADVFNKKSLVTCVIIRKKMPDCDICLVNVARRQRIRTILVKEKPTTEAKRRLLLEWKSLLSQFDTLACRRCSAALVGFAKVPSHPPGQAQNCRMCNQAATALKNVRLYELKTQWPKLFAACQACCNGQQCREYRTVLEYLSSKLLPSVPNKR